MTAFHLAHTYPDKQITWYFPEENNPIGVGEALVPAVSEFLANLGIAHQDIIKHCNGSLKVGLKFDNWNRDGESYYFPFGIVDQKAAHNSTSLLMIMKEDKVPPHILDYADISTQFRTTEMLSYLDTLVSRYPNLNVIREKTSKEQLEGTWDLLIDSTGFGRFISKKPNNFKSIQHIIPNNKAFVYRSPYTDRSAQQKPYSTFTAKDYGWIWHIPLRDNIAFGYVHHDKYDVKQQFIDHVEGVLGHAIDPSNIREVKFMGGRDEIHLENNVVGIGLSSSFIEPLESTGLYLTTSAIHKLCNYIDGIITEQQYNDSVNEFYDRLTNFIAGHYKYSNRPGPYWDHYRSLDVTPYVPMDIFPTVSWDWILSGFNKSSVPKNSVDPLELIAIKRGRPFHEWIQDDTNIN